MRPWHSKGPQPLIHSILSWLRTCMYRNSSKQYLVEESNNVWLHTTLEGPWPHMTLEVSWDGLGTLSCGLSQSHGQGSRLVREMALKHILPKFIITHLSGAHLDWIVTLGPKLKIEWVSGDVFGIIGQDSSLPKSSYQVVMIFQFSSVTLRYILYRFLSNDCNFPEVLNLNRLFLKHNRFTCS